MLVFTNLLVFGFLIKIFARNTFNYVREKYGTETHRRCRSYERLVSRQAKNDLDIQFLLNCKKEGIIPKFARPKLSVGNNETLTRKIVNRRNVQENT